MIKLKVFLLISISVTIHLAITVICKPVGGEEKGKEIEKDVVPQKSSNLTRKFPRIKKGKLRTIKHLKKYRPLITEDLQHSYDDEMNWYIEAKNRSQKQKSKLKKPELSEKKRKRYQKDYDWSKYDKFTTKRAASDILVESGLPKLPPSKYHGKVPDKK